MLELFTEDVVCDYERGIWRGRDELRKNFLAVHEQFDVHKIGSYPFLHAITNHWVELMGPDQAQGRCYLLDHATAEPGKSPLLLLGIYADEYVKRDGRWLISRSRIDYIWPDRNVKGGAPGHEMGLPSASSR